MYDIPTNASFTMKRTSLEISKTCAEAEVYNELLSLDDKDILDLGCGNGRHSRDIAARGRGRTVLALEVDEIQHKKNLEIKNASNLMFALGSAEAIPAANSSFDIVFLFKSLHHVPDMGKAMQEIHRVLKPGGYTYISEPFHQGDFMEIVRLFHNEQKVQELAFEAIRDAVKQGLFEPVKEDFFNSPLDYSGFEDFEDKHMNVSYREHHVSAEVRAEVKRRFESHVSREGPHFVQPIRVDLLRKQTA